MEYKNGIFTRYGFEPLHESELLNLIRTTDIGEVDVRTQNIVKYYRLFGKCGACNVSLSYLKKFAVTINFTRQDFNRRVNQHTHLGMYACNSACVGQPNLSSGLIKFDVYIALFFLLCRDNILFREYLIDQFLKTSIVAIYSFFDVMFVSGPYSTRSQRLRMLGLDVSSRPFLNRFREKVDFYISSGMPYKNRLQPIRDMTRFLLSLNIDIYLELDTHHIVCAHGNYSLPIWMFEPNFQNEKQFTLWGCYVMCRFCRIEHTLKYLQREFNTTQTLFNILSNKLLK
jgi:hypothetical protein